MIPAVGLVTTPKRPLPKPSKAPIAPDLLAPSMGFSTIPVTPSTKP
jgi:hypothetical protein